MAKMRTIRWKNAPDAHDYPAAASYLALLADGALIERLVAQWQSAAVRHGKAKDLLRAARLALLPADDREVAKDIATIRAKLPLSPILHVCEELAHVLPLQIADSYHRICASYLKGASTNVAYRLATLWSRSISPIANALRNAYSPAPSHSARLAAAAAIRDTSRGWRRQQA
jgi:hypothetical protein